MTPILAACGSSDSDDVDTATTATTAPAASEPADTGSVDAGSSGDDASPLVWARANLGFVSAYVLARGNTAAIVDTGVEGSAAAIGDTLSTLGLNYSDVEHVILTHHHADHAGSIAAVVEQATNATVYAGEADISQISQSDIVAVNGGDDVFGFEMIATPGHTDGHICVIDHDAGVLVAGDAIFGQDGGVMEGPPQFFTDIEESRRSIQAMAALSFNTLLFGHGEPIEDRANTAVQALADTL